MTAERLVEVMLKAIPSGGVLPHHRNKPVVSGTQAFVAFWWAPVENWREVRVTCGVSDDKWTWEVVDRDAVPPLRAFGVIGAFDHGTIKALLRWAGWDGDQPAQDAGE